MPGTTRYSATFDRTYEEDDRKPPEPSARRSRSLSLQANTALYTPLGSNSRSPQQRSSSTDNGKVTEHIPTRTVTKTTVKVYNNPFQFVKVGTCPLYKKAEEQLKKVKEVKKPDVLKEEEEEWQSNLDSWKSRRRKMSEDVFKRQEEIKQLEKEEQFQQCNQRKIKTFSEMVESRAHRGRALSLCLLNNPLEPQHWETEDQEGKSCSNSNYSGGSEENSTVNSEDEGVILKGIHQNNGQVNSQSISKNHRTNVEAHNSITDSPESYDKLPALQTNGLHFSRKDSAFIDSGLESISSSHRAGDTPDSGSDFSQDSGSSLDCESPRVDALAMNGINLYENGSAKFSQMNGDSKSKITHPVSELIVKLKLKENDDVLGFTFLGGKRDGHVTVTSILEGSIAQSSGLQIGDQIICINGNDIRFKKLFEINAILQEGRQKELLELLLWRQSKSAHEENHLSQNGSANGYTSKEDYKEKVKDCNHTVLLPSLMESKSPMNSPKLVQQAAQNYERSIESENEMYVDDFEELQQAQISTSNKQSFNTSSPISLQASNQIPSASSAQIEDSIAKSSLNIIFESHPVNNKATDKPSKIIAETESNTIEQHSPVFAQDLIMPVEKVAEEMEKLILEQLEEEERSKELAAEIQTKGTMASSDHILTAPPRLAEPPKEKPPPPPTSSMENPQKLTSLKRINSTKRIKKEIYKRRSNFLGIENSDETSACDETAIPPPLALEEILKAEMELDREGRKKLEYATVERLTLEEKEIMQREREIIETLESEERQKLLYCLPDDYRDAQSNNAESADELERIHVLQEERKRMEDDRVLEEEQHLRLTEENILREREEYIKKQEDTPSDAGLSASKICAAILPTTFAPSLPSNSKPLETNFDGCNGDGNSILSNNTVLHSEGKHNETLEVPPAKPIPPPKPLKKKEALRKERERLRQEQEALQREREEHRRKLVEQEELLKSQKPHAAAVSRLGPLPPLVQPSPLTTSIAREKSHHGGNTESVESEVPFTNRQNKTVSRGKTAHNDTWGQQKILSVRKQNPETLTESRYNQNHWLIQEAEMRRITELKERQRAAQMSNPQSHLAEDDICSVDPRGTPASQNQLITYAVPDVWNYGIAAKKYPPVVSPDKPLAFTRENVLQTPPKPSRQEHMLSVSGRKRCSHCSEELGSGAAMIIESLQLYYHIHCFQCCVCQAQLGNGSCGTDVRVRNNKLHCHNCYSNDEAGLKFSQV